MHNSLQKTILVVMLALAFAAKSPAPIRDAPGSHLTTPVPERSQEQLAQEQRFNGTQGQVGGVQMKTFDGSSSVEATKYNPEATGNVLAGSERAEQAASKAILAGTKRVEASNSHSWWPFLVALFVGCIGYGAFRSAKGWLDKNVVPNPPKKPKSPKQYY